LFLGPNGRRYEQFKALPKLTNTMLKCHITVTDWRKIIATGAADYLSSEEIEILNLADTHSKDTAERFYHKRCVKQNATKAIGLVEKIYALTKSAPPVPIPRSLAPAAAASSPSVASSVAAPAAVTVVTESLSPFAAAGATAPSNAPICNSEVLALFQAGRRRVNATTEHPKRQTSKKTNKQTKANGTNLHSIRPPPPACVPRSVVVVRSV
jgi:hypothetical protein